MTTLAVSVGEIWANLYRRIAHTVEFLRIRKLKHPHQLVMSVSKTSLESMVFSCMRHGGRVVLKLFLITVSFVAAQSSWAEDIFDPTTGILTIPQITVGQITYTDVKITVGSLLSIGVAPANGVNDIYDSKKNQLQIPLVNSAGIRYFNVSITVGTIISIGGSKINVIPVSSTSFDNRKIAAAAIGPQSLSFTAIAYADFFQDETYSMVTHSLIYDVNNPATINALGKIQFHKKINGIWTDQTTNLLDDDVGCLHPRKAIVADFNGDKKPDVFFACHGFDAAPFPGELQIMLLSQENGRYSKKVLPGKCFCHGAAAADFEGDGYASIIVADQMVEKTPYFLVNNKDGTFAADKTRLPPNLLDKQLWTTEIADIDNDGKFDVFIAGADPDGSSYKMSPTIFINDGGNKFISTKPISLLVPLQSSSNNFVTLDLEYNFGAYYLLRSDYQAISISKITDFLSPAQEIYFHSGPYDPSKFWMTWFPWIGIFDGSVVSLDANFPVKVPVTK